MTQTATVGVRETAGAPRAASWTAAERRTQRPQLQFLTSVEEAVAELERQQGTAAPGQS